LYFGINQEIAGVEQLATDFFSNYRCQYITTGGHIDGCFTPVCPGLIVSILDIDTYSETFPGWEVVYLEGESWSKVSDFLELKKKNQGRWWIKGSEYDTELVDYVETWLRDWTGYVEESVFDVNILVIDQKNIIVNGYNKQAFDSFDRWGITPHICPMRHRYFWDGGVHCVTLDLHRDGQLQDFFPDRT
jgi:N-dimethylarginine dimethylaminohydrolase